jgi:hypothetical protein
VLGRACLLAAVWLSPAVLLETAPRLLADGGRGLWPLVSLAAGAALVGVLLAAPWSALPPRSTLGDLVWLRWPETRATPLAVALAASTLCFVWAQLLALAEVTRSAGGRPTLGVGLAALGLALGTWAEGPARRLAMTGALLAVLGLLVPLGAVLALTDPAWPRVWETVASRARVVFDADGLWARDGGPVRGPGAEIVLPFGAEQQVTLLGPGPARVEWWGGGGWGREVTAPLAVTLRAGDRLVVPDGFAVRFRAGQPIPGAPRSGIDWAEGSGGGGWRPLAGLGFTLLIGALGLPAVHAVLPRGRGGDQAGVLGALLGGIGLAAVALWALYAAWLTPEVYLGGVAGTEVYELPGRLALLGPLGAPLEVLARLGLVGGGLAAAVAALLGAPRGLGAPRSRSSRAPGIRPGLVVLAAVLATVVPLSPWPLLVTACGLAAAGCAPAAVLACWRVRLTASALAVGAAAGLVAFAVLTLLPLTAAGGLAHRAGLGWLVAWPAVVAAPLNALIAWLLSLGPRPSPRAPLPPGLAELHS